MNKLCLKSNQRDSSDWLVYFERNKEELRGISWEAGAELSGADKKVITKSIQIFQLGERSEGKHLAKSARRYAEHTGDQAYFQAMVLFIKEEQRHAADLGRFMTLNGIPIIKKTPTDSVFRWLRHLADLEMSVAVLVCAEIIAQVYYPALQKATRSRILQQLCDQIIADEEDHVAFQSQRLAILRQNKPRFVLSAIRIFYSMFFWVTAAVVWLGHGQIFLAAGLNMRAYIRECQQRLNRAILFMDPNNLEDKDVQDHCESVVASHITRAH